MIFSFASDIGCYRANNEDCYYVPDGEINDTQIAIIADGMGGYNAGEIASKTAVESAIDYLGEYCSEVTQNSVRSAIRAANNRIMEMVKKDIRLKGMGTTMTVAAFKENSVIFGHVGDSRAYLISKARHTIKQLTKDHSYVQMLLDSGEITLEEAYEHPRKNEITRAVGVDRRVRIDTFEIPIEHDDIIVMCTDGLSGFVSDEEILEYVSNDCYEGTNSLINLVKERGGDDNITLICACNKNIVLDNRYKLIRQIGSGGMSKVYGAADMEDEGRMVSVKMLKDELFKDESIREMFKHEAEIAMKLHHENIISAKRYVEENDKAYIILEYVEGSNLKDYIEKNGPMNEKAAINVGMEIARALRYAQNNGYIHKDVKPQNIILDNDMNAYLTDFGLATKEDEADIRNDDMVLGSVYYFSPEHAKGEPVNMRSDIYSLGIVIYELLCGKPPFEGNSTHEVIMAHLHKEPASPNEHNRNISVAISQVILKAIEKDCELRYVNFNSFMSDMQKALKHPSGGFVEYTHVPLVSTHAVTLKRLVVNFGAIAAMFVLLLVLGLTVFNTGNNKNSGGMPNLVNMELYEAEQLLENMGIGYSIEYYEKDDVNSGVVLNQSVMANSPIPSGTTVVLGISINSKDKTMPDLFRMNRNDAVAFLNSANISNVNIEYVDSDLPFDFVVRQEPKIGTTLKNVKSVKLYLSNNHVVTTVPDLNGMNLETAKNTAEDKGFSLGIVYEETGKEQTVNKQLPVGGISQSNDLSIDIWIGERNNKNVKFQKNIDLAVKENLTKVIICYEDEKGIMYYVNEFVLNVGISNKNIEFYDTTNKPKKIHVFYNNVPEKIIENVKAVD